MRILDGADVARLLTPADTLECMRRLFTMEADPGAAGLARAELHYPQGWLRALPAYLAPEGVFGFKVLNRTVGVGMRYVIYVYDLDGGQPVGVVDGNLVTHLRTGAVSALATDLMAPAEVEAAAVIGAGRVAWGQIVALDLVRPAAELRIFSPTPSRREALAAEVAPQVSGRVTVTASLEEALEGAQLVTLATASTRPLLAAAHLHPRLHVNSVGPATRPKHELHPLTFPLFDRIVCDSVELVFREAGDMLAAAGAGSAHPGDAIDLSAVVTGRAPGRGAAAEITLFKSVGTGLQDLIVANHLLRLAAAGDVGTVVPDFTSLKPT